MLTSKKISKKKTIILTVVVILIFALTIYFVINIFFGGKITRPSLPKITPDSESVTMPIMETEFKNDFLIKDPYKKLKQYGQLPVKAGRTGRSNPFQEISFEAKETGE